MFNKIVPRSLLVLLLISLATKAHDKILYKNKKIIIKAKNLSERYINASVDVLDKKTEKKLNEFSISTNILNIKIRSAVTDNKYTMLLITDKKSKIHVFDMYNGDKIFSFYKKVGAIRSVKAIDKHILVITDEKSNIQVFDMYNKEKIVPRDNDVAIRSAKIISNKELCIQLQNNHVYVIYNPNRNSFLEYYPLDKPIQYLGNIQNHSLQLLSIHRWRPSRILLSKNEHGLYFLYNCKTGKRLNETAAKHYKRLNNYTILMQYTGTPYSQAAYSKNAIDLFDINLFLDLDLSFEVDRTKKLNNKPILVEKNKTILYESIKIIHQKLLWIPYKDKTSDLFHIKSGRKLNTQAIVKLKIIDKKMLLTIHKDKTYDLFHIESGRKLNTQAIVRYGTIDKGNMIFTISRNGKYKYYDIDTGKQPPSSLFGKKNRKKIQHLLLHKLQLSLSELSTIKFVDLSPDNKKLYIEYKNQKSKLLDIKSNKWISYDLNPIKPEVLKDNYNDKQEKIGFLHENLRAQDLPEDSTYNVNLEQFPIKLVGKTLLATKTFLSYQ